MPASSLVALVAQQEKYLVVICPFVTSIVNGVVYPDPDLLVLKIKYMNRTSPLKCKNKKSIAVKIVTYNNLMAQNVDF